MPCFICLDPDPFNSHRLTPSPVHLPPDVIVMSFRTSPLANPAVAHSIAAVHPPLTPPASSDSTLSPPVDVKTLEQPANIARPRRMSVSDHALLTRALSNAFSFDGARSRPGSAEAQRRARTRFNVPTSGAGILKDPRATEVFALAYSSDSTQLAAGCGDGSIRLFANSPGQSHCSLQRVAHHTSDRDHLPATCVRYNPAHSGANGDARVLLASYADGTVSQWRVGGAATEAKCVRNTATPGDAAGANSIYAVSYQADGLSFATAGRDHIVRLYDETTGALVRACDNVGSHGHSNRVYALKYAPQDPHTLLSAGWDNSVQFWDTRTGYSTRSIFGPHVCGDALDINGAGTEILTGSWREENGLQRWDFATGKLITNVAWNAPGSDASGTSPAAASSSSSSQSQSQLGSNCMLYCAAYSSDGRTIAAGGAGNGLNQVKLFDVATCLPTERVSFPHALYTLAFAPDASKLAMAGVDNSITVVNL